MSIASTSGACARAPTNKRRRGATSGGGRRTEALSERRESGGGEGFFLPIRDNRGAVVRMKSRAYSGAAGVASIAKEGGRRGGGGGL